MKESKSKQSHYTLSPWGSHLRRRVAFVPTQPTKTRLEFQEEADINNILKTFAKTGVLGDPARQAAAKFGDWTQFPTDYQAALNATQEAADLFFQLPAKIREQHNNDPNEFISYATNPANLEEMVKLGLATKRPDPEVPLSESIAAALAKASAPKGPKPNKPAPKVEETED